MNVLLIATEEYLTLRLLKCLAPLDAVVHIVGAASCPPLRASRYCRRYGVLPLDGSPEAVCADLNRYCRRHRIDVILPSGMASGFLLSQIKERLDAAVLPMPPVEQLRLLNNKWAFSRLLEDQGLPYPESRLIERVETVLSLSSKPAEAGAGIRQSAPSPLAPAQAGSLPFSAQDFNPGDIRQTVSTRDLRFPVIVKPLELDASRGVTRCDTPEAVTAHSARHAALLPLLVQEFIPGVDVGLGLIARRGEVLAATVQKQAPDGSGLEFIAHDGVLEIGRRLMAVLQYDGIAHFDMRLDARDGSVKVLECNPRFWASLPFCMLAGVNYAELGIQLALGQTLTETTARQIGLTFPSRLLAGALRGRRAEWRDSESSRDALRFTLADPLPYVCLGARQIGGRMRSYFGMTKVTQ